MQNNEYMPPIRTECGHWASFDDGSGCSHRCNHCGATIGSIGMPSACKELYKMANVVNNLKGNK